MKNALKIDLNKLPAEYAGGAKKLAFALGFVNDESGAKVVLPDERRPAPEKKKKPVVEEPKPYIPPLRPVASASHTDPSSPKWRPEEIA